MKRRVKLPSGRLHRIYCPSIELHHAYDAFTSDSDEFGFTDGVCGVKSRVSGLGGYERGGEMVHHGELDDLVPNFLEQLGKQYEKDGRG